MVERATVDVDAPPGGWLPPWPNVAELEAVLPHEHWTLVGGLMTQLHCVHAGLDAIRPTNDIDVVLHVETTRGVAARAATALESLGYELAALGREPADGHAAWRTLTPAVRAQGQAALSILAAP